MSQKVKSMQAKYNTKAINLFKEWLKGQKISLTRFSREAKLHHHKVWGWTHGIHVPSLYYAVIMEELTGGAVKCADWVTPSTSKKIEKHPEDTTKDDTET
jgi:hypothetical protein